MIEDTERREAHRALILKITAYAGWALALLSLFISTYLLNKYHLEIVEMQRENKELQISLERSRTHPLQTTAPSLR